MNQSSAPISISVNKLIKYSICGSIAAMLMFLFALSIPWLVYTKHTFAISLQDITPPIINGVSDIKIYVGEFPAYRTNISLSDDFDSKDQISLFIDSSKVNINEPGVYPVTYTATDSSGNSSQVTINLTVALFFPQEAELNYALDNVISQIITPTMNPEQKIRAIYYYVQSHIAFVNSSDKTNWKAEAYRALFVTNTGDCFSFFAASKAFFERLGIKNLDIERPKALAEQMQQTHYWSMVNISEDPNNEIWYHYDSCRLRAEYNHSGCLLTEIQINAYNYVRENFYAYNKVLYPAVCEKIITPTPELEEFYNKD